MNTFIENRIGIVESKKTRLDTLENEIIDSLFDVEQHQAIVNSLSEKLVKYQLSLSIADNNLIRTRSNRDLLEQLIKMAKDGKSTVDTAFSEIDQAETKTGEMLTSQMKKVMDKLIYSAETINRLATLVIRKKAINPLISDDLVSRISTAGTDANNAVALSLVALKSVFATQTTIIESEAAMALMKVQSYSFYKLLTGSDNDQSKKTTDPSSKDGTGNSLADQITKAYEDAKTNYTEVQLAVDIINNQLNAATTLLNKAKVKLSSFQQGFAAGNAAALAS